MRQFLVLAFLFCPVCSFAQFAIVADNDGFVNVRNNGKPGSKVIDKLPSGHLLFCFETEEKWTSIDYLKKGKELNGYVYRDKCKLISDFPRLSVSHRSERRITLKKDSIEVTITTSAFDKRKHKLTRAKNTPDQIDRIDNKRYWGLDGGAPTAQFERIVVRVGQRVFELPKRGPEGLYEPDISSATVNYDRVTSTVYIQTSNSDGASSYSVVWKVGNEGYMDKLVAYGF